MAIGIYGSNILSTISQNDVDVLYAFSPDRETIGDVQMSPMFPNISTNDFLQIAGADGMFKLRLPASIFNQIGFYSVLVKPKTFQTIITDCSYVVTNDNNSVQISKKGIVIPTIATLPSTGLIGYQIEYFDQNNVLINNLVRIVTSSDLVSITTNNNNISPGSTAYVLDNAGTSIFCTVTPDEASLISSNQPVNIGQKGQLINISNTFFDPFYIEVEMVKNTIDTLAIALYGNSTRDLSTGILTYFDDNNNIYKQFNLYQVKNQFTQAIIDVRQGRTIVNFTETFQQSVNGQ